MSTAALIVLLVIGLPLVGFLLWLLFDESFVRIEPGSLGLLLVKGRATDHVLQPGPHWVPALRRREVVEYPAYELSYRTGPTVAAADSESDALERRGPAQRVILGDRVAATLAYTVRFRLDLKQLRSVHERFGPAGIWSAVRDDVERTLASALADPAHTADRFFGAQRAELDAALGSAVAAALAADGMQVTTFCLGAPDLGTTGETIQATARARYELEREEVEATNRLARARNDVELGQVVPGFSAALVARYREGDQLRDLARRSEALSLVVNTGTGADANARVAELDLDGVESSSTAVLP